MTQASISIANGSGAAVRAAVNSALEAITTKQSGGTEPSTTYPFMEWADTANDLLKQRNAANSAWITKGVLSAEYGNIYGNQTINGQLTIQGDSLDPGLTIKATGTSGNKDAIVVVDCADTGEAQLKLYKNGAPIGWFGFLGGAGPLSIVNDIDGSSLLLASNGITVNGVLVYPTEQSLASNGYQKLPGGLIIQWGGTITSAAGTVTVTYPVAFPNQVTSVLAVTTTTEITWANIQNQTTTNFGINGFDHTGARKANAAFWFAIGY